jgi:hypothetical protein
MIDTGFVAQSYTRPLAARGRLALCLALTADLDQHFNTSSSDRGLPFGEGVPMPLGDVLCNR